MFSIIFRSLHSVCKMFIISSGYINTFRGSYGSHIVYILGWLNSTQPTIKIQNTVISIFILCQKNSRICNFMWIAKSTKRNVFHELGRLVLTEAYYVRMISSLFYRLPPSISVKANELTCNHWRINIPRHNSIRPNNHPTPQRARCFNSQRTCKPKKPSFRGCI